MSAPGDADDLVRVQGEALVTRLSALFRIGRAYDVKNEIFRRQVEALLEVLAPVLDLTGEAVLARVGADLYLNGGRIPVRRASFRFHQALAQELERHGLAGVRFVLGLSADELETFFRLLFDPERGAGLALVDACRESGLAGVQPGLHATSAEEEARALDTLSRGSGHGGGAGDGEGAGETSAARLASRLASAEHARSLLLRTQAVTGAEVRRARRVVQPVVEAAQAGDPVVFGLSGLARHDEGEYARSANVCVLAVSMGHALGFDRKTLADLAVAALLRDVGLAEGGAPIESHPVAGARLIAQSARLDETAYRCLRVALEHHGGEATSVLSRLVAVADAYVNLLVVFGITPFDALGIVLGPWGGRFDAAARWALVEALGLFPPGQIVLLDDGSWAVVLAPGAEDPERPHVRLVRSPEGAALAPGEEAILSPLPAQRTVMRALTAEECAATEPPRAA